MYTHRGNNATEITSPTRENIYHSATLVSRAMRERQNRHRGSIIWLTGLSGAGKTTIARELEDKLFSQGYQIVVLDGDNMRHGLCADLGFSREDRRENIRRVGEVARLFLETGTIAISAFISPYAADRDKIRASVPDGDYVETYLECSIEECERRDPKGLYKKARAGIIRGFTGIDDPFEPPNKPELTINTEELTVEQSVNAILRYMRNEGYS